MIQYALMMLICNEKLAMRSVFVDTECSQRPQSADISSSSVGRNG